METHKIIITRDRVLSQVIQAHCAVCGKLRRCKVTALTDSCGEPVYNRPVCAKCNKELPEV